MHGVQSKTGVPCQGDWVFGGSPLTRGKVDAGSGLALKTY